MPGSVHKNVNVCFPYCPQSGDFKSLGILVGMSLVQGGSGSPFFAPSVYDYITGLDMCRLIVQSVKCQMLS